MVESNPNPIHTEVHKLLMRGARTGAVMRMEWSPKADLDTREKRWSMVTEYYYTPKALQDVADLYGVTREAVRQRIKDTLNLLYRAIPEEARKDLTPPDEMSLKKPLTVGDRRRIHEKRGYGVTLAVAEAMDKVGPDYRAIRVVTGLSGEKVSMARYHLAKWGTSPVPRRSPYYSRHGKLTQELLDTSKSDAEIDKELRKIRGGFIREKVDSEGGPIVSAKRVIREAGYRCRADKRSIFVEVLRRAGIPLVSIPASRGSKNQVRYYYVIATQHLQRAIRALETEASLNGYR